MYDYPIYKQHKKSSLVVKFTDLYKGTVVIAKTLAEDSEPDPIGYYTDGWARHTKIDVWEDYTPPKEYKIIRTFKGM